MAGLTAVSTGAAGLGTRTAHYTLLAVWLLGICSLLIDGAPPGSGPILIGSSLLALVATWLLTAPGPGALPPAMARVVAVVSVCAGASTLIVLPPVGETWHFNFPTYLLALLTMRGNEREGIVGGLLLILTGATAGVIAQAGTEELAEFLALPVVAWIVGIVWRKAFVVAAEAERRHNLQARVAGVEAMATEAAIASEKAIMAQVRAEAEPVLTSIRDSQRIDDEMVREIEVVEGSIRDRLRSPLLRHPLINASVRRARQRDVRVVLLGSETTQHTMPADPLAAAVARIITATRAGTVTVRAVPPGRGRGAAISVLVEGEGEPQRTVLDDGGVLLERR